MARASAAGVLVLVFVSGSLGAERAAPTPAEKPQPKRFAPDPVPTVDGEGRPVRTVTDQGFKVEIDLSSQLLGIHAPVPEVWRENVDAIEVGDTVTVAVDGASLRQGQQSLAALRKGQRLVVTNVKDTWLATAVTDGGQAKAGWVQKSQVKLSGHEDQILPTLNHAVEGNFVSAALLTQKSKQFDDGLYAAVELAAQNGAGRFEGKTKLLLTLLEAVQSQPASKGTAVLAAALQQGGQKVAVPPAWQAAVQNETNAFLGDPLRSKPLGFYTWSPELSAIFRQDRLLQTEIKVTEGAPALAAALASSTEAQQAYDKYLTLTSRLTNPWKHHDLRALATPGPADAAPVAQARIFPPSTSHENELVMQLYGDKPIPEGFDLMNELITRIQSGAINLTPRPESGWYDYQTFALEPLVKPEQTPEATQLSFSDEYKKLLTELFKGALALARETHVKQMEIPRPASRAFDPEPEPKKQIYIRLNLSAEPLVTHYRRKAESYRFVRTVLQEAFGPEALTNLHRQTATGPVTASLADELSQMEALFSGAATAAARQIGLNAPAQPEAEGQAATFLKWASELALDPDLGQDARMMVPVFYDQMRKRTKVWVFLGWTRRSVSFGMARAPGYKVFDAEGNAVPPGQKVEVHFHGRSESLLYPEMAEVYVGQILNRDEFRRHCDVYRTRSAILENLR